MKGSPSSHSVTDDRQKSLIETTGINIQSHSITVLVFIRSRPKLPGDVLADLADVLQAELVQDSAHITVHVLVGEF